LGSLSYPIENFEERPREASLGEDNSQPGAIVVLTICIGRHHAGTRKPLVETGVRAHSTRGDDDRFSIGVTN
jgi:hypothetical protein